MEKDKAPVSEQEKDKTFSDRFAYGDGDLILDDQDDDEDDDSDEDDDEK